MFKLVCTYLVSVYKILHFAIRASIMRQLLLLLLSLTFTAAYDCNITLVSGVANVESSSMCDYVNYHVSMLLFFGGSAIMFVLVAVLHIACYGPNMTINQEYTVQWYVWWALGCLILMPGFEFAFAVFYLCVACLVFASIAHACISRVPLQHRSNAVDTTPAVVTVVVVDDDAGSDNCSICLESRAGKPWFIAPCKHSFHLECIQKWAQGTCPLCRKKVWD